MRFPSLEWIRIWLSILSCDWRAQWQYHQSRTHIHSSPIESKHIFRICTPFLGHGQTLVLGTLLSTGSWLQAKDSKLLLLQAASYCCSMLVACCMLYKLQFGKLSEVIKVKFLIDLKKFSLIKSAKARRRE